MKVISRFSLLLVLAALLSGCRTYDYRIVQPAQLSQRIADRTVVAKYDPLEYRFTRRHGKLEMRIINPTDDRIVLEGNRSYVIDPQGESHPFPGRVLGPHSYIAMLLPPEPITGQVTGSYGPGWGWAPGMYGGYGYPFHPYRYGFYNDFFWGPPPVSYYQVPTPYDWDWRTGPARLHLTYERNGKTFDHDLEFTREKVK